MQDAHLEDSEELRGRVVPGELDVSEVGGDARDEAQDPCTEERDAEQQGQGLGVARRSVAPLPTRETGLS